jgi:soluble lytic murein transglycosylase-like protein
MFDPRRNALYAARFLRRLHSDFGDWSAAIGAYHSRTAARATRYRARVGEIRAKLTSADTTRRVAALPAWPLARLGEPARRPGARAPVGDHTGVEGSIRLQMRARPPVDMSPRPSLWE